MKLKKLPYATLFALALVISCSKDDGPSATPNSSPVITNTTKTFTVAENISDIHVIGTVNATDADKDALTFSISANSDNLFEISDAGTISLAVGKTLSFATKSSHPLEITVSDGTDSAKANFTINVTEVNANNQTPVIEAQSFTAAEDIADTTVIGTVQASDAEGDNLHYGLTSDSSELFEISIHGELSLLLGQRLDFDTADEHTLTVSVSDGSTSAQATITVTVTEVENVGPSLEAQVFNVSENISDSYIIGTVVATDPNEGDDLIFTITTNDNNLFEITSDGQLSLASGLSLDYATSSEHTITVEVTDNNNEPVSAEITITVTETIASDPSLFVTKWTTGADMEQIEIGVNKSVGAYDFQINWGDGTVENLSNNDILNDIITHTYETAGTYVVSVGGTFPAIKMFNSNTPLKLSSIEQWGTIQWIDMSSAFKDCQSMVYNATDIPDLSQVESISSMFSGATSFNGNLNSWNVSNVTNMSSMFSGATSFNGDLSNWVVDNVTNMGGMFRLLANFNADISGWNVANVTNFYGMFVGATSFDQNLGGWNIGNAANMSGMLNDSGLSTANYDATLTGWANQNDTPNNINFGAEGLTYCSASSAIDELVNTHGWTITDAGENCN